MAEKRIIGRRNEKMRLARAFRSNDPEFIAIYGRRRVGKTHLVREFFDDAIHFEIVGIHDAKLSEQLDNFAQSLSNSIGMGIRTKTPQSWAEAFRQLQTFLESSSHRGKKRKRVVFLDELPWLSTPRSRFLSSLEHFWNAWGSRQKDLILVVCGSAASWIIQNIVRSKGGLHNRLTDQIPLYPFSLRETEEFFQSRGVNLTRSQIVELYMTMGGVPHYLKQAEPGLSTSQIIDKVCFSPSGLLRHEFEKLYASLFDVSAQHVNIVKALASKRMGLTRTEFLKSAGLSSGGTATHRLEELEESGFIQSRVPFGKKSSDSLYRLMDEYSLFYLQWIDKLGRRSPGIGYWLKMRNRPSRRTWAGYAFENICLKHVLRLKEALGISGVHTEECPWWHPPSKESGIPGAQIDLLIDRADQTINICEMKFSENEFTIDSRYAENLRRKIDVFRKVTKTRKNIFLTMVTSFGLKDNTYAKELVNNSLALEDLF